MVNYMLVYYVLI